MKNTLRGPHNCCVIYLFQFLDDMSGEMFVYFCMTRNWLGNLCFRILVPVMSPAMPDKDATKLFNLFDQVFSFQET